MSEDVKKCVLPECELEFEDSSIIPFCSGHLANLAEDYGLPIDCLLDNLSLLEEVEPFVRRRFLELESDLYDVDLIRRRLGILQVAIVAKTKTLKRRCLKSSCPRFAVGRELFCRQCCNDVLEDEDPQFYLRDDNIDHIREESTVRNCRLSISRALASLNSALNVLPEANRSPLAEETYLQDLSHRLETHSLYLRDSKEYEVLKAKMPRFYELQEKFEKKKQSKTDDDTGRAIEL